MTDATVGLDDQRSSAQEDRGQWCRKCVRVAPERERLGVDCLCSGRVDEVDCSYRARPAKRLGNDDRDLVTVRGRTDDQFGRCTEGLDPEVKGICLVVPLVRSG